MTQIVVGLDHPALLRWAEDAIGDTDIGCFSPETSRCVALLEDDFTPIAVLVLNGWTKSGVEGSIATDHSRRWANRRFLQACYGYIFDRCGLDRFTMITDVANTEANQMHADLGHVCEGRLRSWFSPGKDAFVYSFLKSDWESSKWHPCRKSVNTTNQ